MRTSIVISVLLGAGALGHPHFKLNNPLGHLHHHKRQDGPSEVKTYVENGRVIVDDIFIKTVYGNSVPAPSPAAAAAPVNEKVAVPAPVVTVTAAPVQAQQKWAKPQQKQEEHPQQQQQQPKPQPKPQPAPDSVTSVAAAPVQTQPASSGGSNDGSPMSGSKSLLQTANYFRNLQGYNDLEYDSTLQGNAAKTNTADGGNEMKHELNAGSLAQCIAEGHDSTTAGDLSPFDLIYLAWLCEIPEPNLGTMCATMKTATGMSDHTSDPSHAKILRTASYTKMGCNFLESTNKASYGGLWTCDFA